MASATKCRIVFMGTPDFAATVLRGLSSWSNGDIVAVYSQPDRPSGRGHKYHETPVKRLASELGLPMLQPESLKDPSAILTFADFTPDVLVVAAYGMILPAAVLAVPRLDSVNVHPSLLPAYRGAAPIQRALMENWQSDAKSGVSVMRIVQRLDSGPVFDVSEMSVLEHTYGSLHDALALEGARLLVRVLENIVNGTAHACAQNDALATYAAKIDHEDRMISWGRPAAAVHAHIRAMTPKPGARASFLFREHFAPKSFIVPPGFIGNALHEHVPGSLCIENGVLKVACSDCWYVLPHIQPEGGKRMRVSDFVNGHLRAMPLRDCGLAIFPSA